PTHHAPPCRSMINGKGPSPLGLKRRARSGLSPWRRYSTSSTSMLNDPLAMVGPSGARERVGDWLLGYVVPVRGTIVLLTVRRNPTPIDPGTAGDASPRRRARPPGSPRC